MRLPDVNVLVHALRADSSSHDRCRQWLEETANDARPVALTGVVLAGVVRVTTHPRVFASPSRPADVLAELERLLALRSCVRVEPGPRHWGIYRDVLDQSGAAGNLAQDAWLAAIAIEHGCTLVTLDGDFARFEGLDHARP